MRVALWLTVPLLLTSGVSPSEALQTLQLEFERRCGGEGAGEVVRGNIYYRAPARVVVLVTYPIKQLMILEGLEVTIYYPEEKRAFVIAAETTVLLPFFQAFLGVMDEDYGLTELGYTLHRYATRGDTLLTYWSPPTNVFKPLGEFALVYVAGKIVYAESKREDGTTISRSSYQNHVRYGAFYFPMEIANTRYAGADSTVEGVRYSNPKFDAPLPKEVVEFQIPLGVEVQEARW